VFGYFEYVLVFVWVYVYVNVNVGALMFIYRYIQYLNEHYTCVQINVCLNIYVLILLTCQFNM